MPIYDYDCTACEERFEALVSFEAAPPICSSCGSDQTERVFSMFATTAGSSKRAAASRAAISSACGGGSCGCH